MGQNSLIQQLQSFQEVFLTSLQYSLPGKEAHSRISPLLRINGDTVPILSAKESAVLVLIYPNLNDLCTLLIERNEYKGAHSGQISFPGGKKNDKDISLRDTAIREAIEEVGINSEKIIILGQLTPLYIPISNFNVYPFLGISFEYPHFKLDPKEVKSCIEFPVAQLLDDNCLKSKPIYMELIHKEIELPFFDIKGKTVWGASAMILNELKEIYRQFQSDF